MRPNGLFTYGFHTGRRIPLSYGAVFTSNIRCDTLNRLSAACALQTVHGYIFRTWSALGFTNTSLDHKKISVAGVHFMDVHAKHPGRTGDGFALPVHLARSVAAAVRAPYPATVIRPLLERYGFDGLSYIVARTEGRTTTGEIAWSTYPPQWPALYRRATYAAVDSRLTKTRHRVTPYLWDSADSVDNGLAGQFARDAQRFGIRSGVVISLHDGMAGQVALTFDSVLSELSGDRREAVLASLGDLMLIAMALHEGVLSWRVARTAVRKHAGPCLTQRECDCLKFAARGMTSADIGNKLSVTERTVNFHFGRLRRKLGALNRPEAIAKGVSMGLVTLD